MDSAGTDSDSDLSTFDEDAAAKAVQVNGESSDDDDLLVSTGLVAKAAAEAAGDEDEQAEAGQEDHGSGSSEGGEDNDGDGRGNQGGEEEPDATPRGRGGKRTGQSHGDQQCKQDHSASTSTSPPRTRSATKRSRSERTGQHVGGGDDNGDHDDAEADENSNRSSSSSSKDAENTTPEQAQAREDAASATASQGRHQSLPDTDSDISSANSSPQKRRSHTKSAHRRRMAKLRRELAAINGEGAAGRSRRGTKPTSTFLSLVKDHTYSEEVRKERERLDKRFKEMMAKETSGEDSEKADATASAQERNQGLDQQQRLVLESLEVIDIPNDHPGRPVFYLAAPASTPGAGGRPRGTTPPPPPPQPASRDWICNAVRDHAVKVVKRHRHVTGAPAPHYGSHHTHEYDVARSVDTAQGSEVQRSESGRDGDSDAVKNGGEDQRHPQTACEQQRAREELPAWMDVQFRLPPLLSTLVCEHVITTHYTNCRMPDDLAVWLWRVLPHTEDSVAVGIARTLAALMHRAAQTQHGCAWRPDMDEVARVLSVFGVEVAALAEELPTRSGGNGGGDVSDTHGGAAEERASSSGGPTAAVAPAAPPHNRPLPFHRFHAVLSVLSAAFAAGPHPSLTEDTATATRLAYVLCVLMLDKRALSLVPPLAGCISNLMEALPSTTAFRVVQALCAHIANAWDHHNLRFFLRQLPPTAMCRHFQQLLACNAVTRFVNAQQHDKDPKPFLSPVHILNADDLLRTLNRDLDRCAVTSSCNFNAMITLLTCVDVCVAHTPHIARQRQQLLMLRHRLTCMDRVRERAGRFLDRTKYRWYLLWLIRKLEGLARRRTGLLQASVSSMLGAGANGGAAAEAGSAAQHTKQETSEQTLLKKKEREEQEKQEEQEKREGQEEGKKERAGKRAEGSSATKGHDAQELRQAKALPQTDEAVEDSEAPTVANVQEGTTEQAAQVEGDPGAPPQKRAKTMQHETRTEQAGQTDCAHLGEGTPENEREEPQQEVKDNAGTETMQGSYEQQQRLEPEDKQRKQEGKQQQAEADPETQQQQHQDERGDQEVCSAPQREHPVHEGTKISGVVQLIREATQELLEKQSHKEHQRQQGQQQQQQEQQQQQKLHQQRQHEQQQQEQQQQQQQQEEQRLHPHHQKEQKLHQQQERFEEACEDTMLCDNGGGEKHTPQQRIPRRRIIDSQESDEDTKNSNHDTHSHENVQRKMAEEHEETNDRIPSVSSDCGPTAGTAMGSTSKRGAAAVDAPVTENALTPSSPVSATAAAFMIMKSRAARGETGAACTTAVSDPRQRGTTAVTAGSATVASDSSTQSGGGDDNSLAHGSRDDGTQRANGNVPRTAAAPAATAKPAKSPPKSPSKKRKSRTPSPSKRHKTAARSPRNRNRKELLPGQRTLLSYMTTGTQANEGASGASHGRGNKGTTDNKCAIA